LPTGVRNTNLLRKGKAGEREVSEGEEEVEEGRIKALSQKIGEKRKPQHEKYG